jgi:polyphenol oxidase
MFQRQVFPSAAAAGSNPLVVYQSTLLADRGIPHAFSTRLGGISASPFDSLNLGNPSGPVQDDPANIAANYAILQSAIGCTELRRLWAHQVHGKQVLTAQGSAETFECGRPGDALVSADPNCVLAVRTADCMPILVSDETGQAVAAVHAGWRGIIAGVLPGAVTALAGISRAGAAARFVAAIGPCIGVDAMEVGPEVLAAFVAVFGPDAPIRRRDNGKGQVDLRQACRIQLLRAGVAEERIDVSDRCTHRDSGEFFSHRRTGGITGRMAALIGARTQV